MSEFQKDSVYQEQLVGTVDINNDNENQIFSYSLEANRRFRKYWVNTQLVFHGDIPSVPTIPNYEILLKGDINGSNNFTFGRFHQLNGLEISVAAIQTFMTSGVVDFDNLNVSIGDTINLFVNFKSSSILPLPLLYISGEINGFGSWFSIETKEKIT